MRNAWILWLATMFGACAATEDDTSAIPRPLACQAQAETWCDAAGFPTPACHSWYLHECEPSGPDGAIDATEQDACLQAIATATPPGAEPDECRATWF